MKKFALFICIIMVFQCMVSCENKQEKKVAEAVEKTNISTAPVTTDNSSKKSFYQWFSNKEFAEAIADNFKKKPDDLISEKELGEFNGGISAVSGINDTVKNLKGISNLKSIEAFATYKNDVEIIPDEICRLKNLKVLDLCKAFYLKKLPENIGDLKNLEYLRLDFTLIKELPQSFTRLKKLKYLDLTGSSITELPEDIGNLKNLEFLNISSTKIKELPESLSELKNLRVLNCRDSFVENLPKNIGNMSALQVVDMFNCRLTYVPKSVKNLKNLQYFNLFDNYGIKDDSYKSRINDDVLSCKNDKYDYGERFYEISDKYFD